MPAPSSGVGAPSPPCTSTTPGAAASSSAAWSRLKGSRNSRFTDNAWPTYTGTRTHVAVTRIASSCRILWVSVTSLTSSEV